LGPIQRYVYEDPVVKLEVINGLLNQSISHHNQYIPQVYNYMTIQTMLMQKLNIKIDQMSTTFASKFTNY